MSIDRLSETPTRQSVVVDLTRLKCLHCGLGQYCLHLGRALARATSPDIAPELLLPLRNSRLLEDVALPQRSAYPWMKEKFQRQYRVWTGGLLSRQSRYSLWHATTQSVQYLPLDERVPVVLTIHDLNFLREKPRDACQRNLRRVQALVDRSSAVTTISHFVANEIRSHLDLRGKPVRVVYNGLIAEDYPDAPPPTFVDDRPFLYSIGDITRKKNFHVLIGLLARLPQYRLIIAGNDRTTYAKEIRRIAADAGLSDRVILPGIVSDEDRYWLYRNCTAFFFPSLTEGFGLPVIEAMRFGKPVFLSDATSLPEVGGPMAFYWTSFDPDAMLADFQTGMAAYAADPMYPVQLAAHARQFSWDKAAAQYLALYCEVLKGIGQTSARRAA